MRQRLNRRFWVGTVAIAAALTHTATATALPFPPAPAKFTITPTISPSVCATVERRGTGNEHVVVPRTCAPGDAAQQFTYDPATKHLKSVARSGDCLTVFSNGESAPAYDVWKCGENLFPQRYNLTSEAHIESEPTRAVRTPYCMDYPNFGGAQGFIAQNCRETDNQKFTLVSVP